MKRKERKCWVKPWLTRRPLLGIYDTLISELRIEEEVNYRNYLRMTKENFEEIYRLVEEDITRKNTEMHDSIPARLKFAAIIRFISTGESSWGSFRNSYCQLH